MLLELIKYSNIFIIIPETIIIIFDSCAKLSLSYDFMYKLLCGMRFLEIESKFWLYNNSLQYTSHLVDTQLSKFFNL